MDNLEAVNVWATDKTDQEVQDEMERAFRKSLLLMSHELVIEMLVEAFQTSYKLMDREEMIESIAYSLDQIAKAERTIQ